MNRFQKKWANRFGSSVNEMAGFHKPASDKNLLLPDNKPSDISEEEEEIIKSLCRAYALSFKMIDDESIDDIEASRYESLCKNIAELVKNMYGPKSIELLRNAMRGII